MRRVFRVFFADLSLIGMHHDLLTSGMFVRTVFVSGAQASEQFLDRIADPLIVVCLVPCFCVCVCVVSGSQASDLGVSLGPSSSAPILGCAVARCLWESHWREVINLFDIFFSLLPFFFSLFLSFFFSLFSLFFHFFRFLFFTLFFPGCLFHFFFPSCLLHSLCVLYTRRGRSKRCVTVGPRACRSARACLTAGCGLRCT